MTPQEIRQLRETMQMTQSEFAARLGLKTKGAVSLWESGERTPTGPAIVALELLAEKFSVILGKRRK